MTPEDILKYAYESGCLAHEDMLRDQRFAHLGVLPLWDDVDGAWDWFSKYFLLRHDFVADAEKEFRDGWNSGGLGVF